MKFFPSSKPPLLGRGPEAGLDQSSGAGTIEEHLPTASCSIQDTKSINAGETVANNQVFTPRRVLNALGTRGGWHESTPRRTRPVRHCNIVAGETRAFLATGAHLQQELTRLGSLEQPELLQDFLLPACLGLQPSAPAQTPRLG